MMKDIRIFTTSIKMLCLCVSVFNLISCTQGELMFRGNNIASGYVSITPNKSVYALPTHRYHFYNTNGTTPYQSLTDDGAGNFHGSLPAGTYRVIATNTNARNVVFNDMHNHEMAMVQANVVSQRKFANRNGEVMTMAQPDQVYRVVIEELTVTTNDTIQAKPIPDLLTRSITLSFGMDNELQALVTGLKGSLPGIYPSVQLFTGKTTDTEMARAPGLYTDYVAEKNTGRWMISIDLFGLCDPEHGEIYRNISNVTLSTNTIDYEIEVDLTESLSNIMENYEGALPVDIPIQLNVELELVDIEIAASVQSWSYVSNGMEVIVPITID